MSETKNRFPVRKLCIAAMLMALSVIIGIICKNFMTWQIYNRITFENFPIIIAGFCFGPVWGALVGAGADLISCLCSANPVVNPIISAGAATVGLLSGLIPWIVEKVQRKPRGKLALGLGVVSAHLIGQVLIKSIGKIVWYDMPLNFAFLSLAFSCGIGTFEFLLIMLLLRNREIHKTLMQLTDYRL